MKVIFHLSPPLPGKLGKKFMVEVEKDGRFCVYGTKQMLLERFSFQPVTLFLVDRYIIVLHLVGTLLCYYYYIYVCKLHYGLFSFYYLQRHIKLPNTLKSNINKICY